MIALLVLITEFQFLVVSFEIIWSLAPLISFSPEISVFLIFKVSATIRVFLSVELLIAESLSAGSFTFSRESPVTLISYRPVSASVIV